jgi:hypothetical protein
MRWFISGLHRIVKISVSLLIKRIYYSMKTRSFVASTFAVCALTTSLLTPSMASANSNCQCVGYVKNRFGISKAMGNAKDMVRSLPGEGFSQVSTPTPGAVVVMQPSFSGSDPIHGHVGIVESVGESGKISVRGANQAGKGYFTEAGCSNVNVVNFATATSGRSDISFWVKGSTSAQNPGQGGNAGSTTNVSFQAKTGPWTVRVRSGPGTNNQLVRKVAPNTPVNFDAWTFGETIPDGWTKQPDARWYRVAGTNEWIASATVVGNAPGSRAMP